jgi:xanthine dehydrogenase small subunit
MPITVQTFERLDEAAAALSAERGARFLAGGTLVMRAINQGDVSLTTIVRTTDQGLRQIRPAGARIEIGAGVTMSQILASRELAFLHPAARVVGGPAVRSMATIGGNLFAPTPYGDFATALLTLDASVLIHGGYSPREVPLDQFLAGRSRGAGGLVAGVALSRPASESAFRFLKVARVRPKGLALITIAAHLPAAGGRVGGARVAYGAMAPTPIRVAAVERALEGRTLDETGIGPALAAAAEGTQATTDAIATDWYRREIAPIHLRRLLLGDGAGGRP